MRVPRRPLKARQKLGTDPDTIAGDGYITSPMAKELTDLACRNAKGKDKSYKLTDARGMYLLVFPSGAKGWRLRFTWEGKEALMSLGVYPDVPLVKAREARDRARELIAQGINPIQVRKERKAVVVHAAQNTFGVIAANFMKAGSKHWVQTHTESLRYRLDRYILPHLAHRPIDQIKPAELSAFLRPLLQIDKIETARRVRMVCGQVFRYAIDERIIDSDPTRDLAKIRSQKNKRHFSAFTETGDVTRLMRAIVGYRGSIEVAIALRLSAYLFQRPGEIRTMRWKDIDWAKSQWRYVVSKTNTDHIVPLAPQAAAALREIQPFTSHSEFVFPGARSSSRPLSENAVRVALRTLGFSNEEMTPHGFRAMARSLLAEMGWKIDAIERQLAHKPSGPLGAAYDRAQFLQERTKMMQAWADYLDELTGKPKSDASEIPQ